MLVPPPPPRYFLNLWQDSRILFAFDFDGTLVSEAADPSEVQFSQGVRETIYKASRQHAFVICSGRSLSDLEQYFPPQLEIDLIGNHGLEWGLKGKEVRSFTSPEWLTLKGELLRSLHEKVKESGGWIEDKGASVTLHYRQSPRWWSTGEASQWLQSLLGSKAQLLPGKLAWNFLPLKVSKGEALVAYAKERLFQQIIYFGDEETDETVFVRKDHALTGVKVGPGDTAASYRVPQVQAVHDWLTELVQ